MSREIGEPGGVKFGTQASVSTNRWGNPFRLFWYDMWFFFQVIFWLLLIGAVIVGGGLWLGRYAGFFGAVVVFIGAIFLLLGLVVSAFAVFAVLIGSRNFKHGLLTAGIVDDSVKNSVIHIAAITTGGTNDYVYGIKRETYDRFPHRILDNENRIACVSTFAENKEDLFAMTWHNFHPTPVVMGTGNRKVIAKCLEIVSEGSDGDYFSILNQFLSQHKIPEKFEDMYVVDAKGNLIETRVLKESDRKTPPPLPSKNPPPIPSASSAGLPFATTHEAPASQSAEMSDRDVLDILFEVLKLKGLSVTLGPEVISEAANGFHFDTEIVSTSMMGEYHQTCTTLSMVHPILFPNPVYEYQHSVGETTEASIKAGFEQWVQLDWPVLEDAAREEPQNCTHMDMEFGAEQGGGKRRVILGPVMHMGIDQSEGSGDGHPSGCPCCLFTNSAESFKEILHNQTESYAIRLFAMRDDDGSTSADCRVNGEEWDPGKVLLSQYANDWPVRGFESRKQLAIVVTPVD